MPTSKLEEEATRVYEDAPVPSLQVPTLQSPCETKPACSSRYKMMSFYIPCVAVAIMYSCEKDCGLTAIVSALLAGCSGILLYTTLKRIKHRKHV